MLPLVILAIENDDDRAFMVSLYERYRRLMLSEIRQLIKEQWSIEDVFQITLEKLIGRIVLLQSLEEHQLVNYIVTAARHHAINFLKKDGRETCISAEEAELLQNAESAEDAVLGHEYARRLAEVWPLISDRNRYLLEAKYILDLSLLEIADSLKIKPDSVRMELSRARKQARELLYNMEEEVAQ